MSDASRAAELARWWQTKAHESLEDAATVMEAGHLAFAVNRLYYACFYAVSALLAWHCTETLSRQV